MYPEELCIIIFFKREVPHHIYVSNRIVLIKNYKSYKGDLFAYKNERLEHLDHDCFQRV